jgi:hypothetical protein
MPHPRRAPVARRVALALVLVGVVCFSFTPPGRAIAEDVADLVGIGDAPTVDHDEQGPVRPTAGAVVIGTGTTPDEVRFEIVAFEGQRSEAEQQRTELVDPSVGTCVALDWPDVGPHTASSICIGGPQRDPLPTPSITDREGTESEGALGPGAALTVQGLVGPTVDELTLTYETPSGEPVAAPLTLAKLDSDLARQVGAEQEFGFFVAFLPDEHVGEGGYFSDVMTTVELVAYGDGEEIKRLDLGAIVAQDREDAGEHARELQRLEKAGEAPRAQDAEAP